VRDEETLENLYISNRVDAVWVESLRNEKRVLGRNLKPKRGGWG